MRWAVLGAACNLPPIKEAPLHWAQTLAAARKVDIQIPRTALGALQASEAKPHAGCSYSERRKRLHGRQISRCTHRLP